MLLDLPQDLTSQDTVLFIVAVAKTLEAFLIKRADIGMNNSSEDIKLGLKINLLKHGSYYTCTALL